MRKFDELSNLLANDTEAYIYEYLTVEEYIEDKDCETTLESVSMDIVSFDYDNKRDYHKKLIELFDGEPVYEMSHNGSGECIYTKELRIVEEFVYEQLGRG